eukprot:CAMPEP_0172645704 /NCGR_PEP_ID=MMETSP1068-20121228/239868_1 /TAXON_ID=35684 /ORGANISM="Pseudopedinella elastica, Strain CCMP716" /LENGTH=95 /DNA_ID=CAMNT_0013459951 /DNA_START=1264 /DNA_END=1551 /DNA_ORIENTATION=+
MHHQRGIAGKATPAAAGRLSDARVTACVANFASVSDVAGLGTQFTRVVYACFINSGTQAARVATASASASTVTCAPAPSSATAGLGAQVTRGVDS